MKGLRETKEKKIKKKSIKRRYLIIKIKTIVADTNVWYHLSKNNKKLLDYINSKGNLYITPISFLELISKMSINNKSFNRRKNAIHAIIKYAKGCLPMHELVLAGYFGILIKDDINWMDRFRIVRLMENPQELENRKVIYTEKHGIESAIVDIKTITKWRESLYLRFKKGIIDVINFNIEPHYREQVNVGRIISIKNKDKLSILDNPKIYESIISMLVERVKNIAKSYGIEEVNLNEKQVKKAKNKIDCYSKMYIGYIKDILKRGSEPDINDLGDFENFMYLRDDNYMLATTDKKWIRICNKIYHNRILDLNPCLN